jgi:hypothetical protein
VSDCTRCMEKISRIEQRLDTLNPRGRVVQRDHEKGVRVNLGTDENEFLSPWIQPCDRTGASRYLPEVGEQVQIDSHGGDWAQAVVRPLTHSKARPNPAEDADETVHHDRDGERSSVKKGHGRKQFQKKLSLAAGDGGKKAEGASGGGGNLVHELNRQLQGLRAEVTNHTNQIAGVHDAASKMREIAQKVIPGLAAVQPLLNGDPGSLDKATQGVLGNLEAYVAKALQQSIAKLTNGFMSNAMGLVQGFVQQQIAGLLGQVGQLASLHGVEDAVRDPLAAAQGLVTQAASGTAHNLIGAQLGQIEAAFAGTPGEAAFAAIRSQLGGALSGALDVSAGLGGLVDGQQNLVKGMTKSMRFGGYDGEE